MGNKFLVHEKLSLSKEILDIIFPFGQSPASCFPLLPVYHVLSPALFSADR